MKSFLELFESKNKHKVTREAFLYMAPKAPNDEFAQCGTCFMFDSEDKTCAIMGPDVKIEAEWSCGLYVHGKPKQKIIPIKCVIPAAAGLFKDKVRCENCFYFDAEESECVLYQDLNQKNKDFKLDTKVEAKACCNAWTPK